MAAQELAQLQHNTNSGSKRGLRQHLFATPMRTVHDKTRHNLCALLHGYIVHKQCWMCGMPSTLPKRLWKP
jgi:hypothetical protein